MVGSSRSRRSGAEKQGSPPAPRACASRPRTPSTARTWSLPPESRGRPGSPPRVPARNRRRSPPAARGCRRACAGRSRAPRAQAKACAPCRPRERWSISVMGPLGASCATRADAPVLRRHVTSPWSVASWPRMTLSSVDLPAPLRPTSPMRRPAGSVALAPSRISRPRDADDDVVDDRAWRGAYSTRRAGRNKSFTALLR